MNIPNILTIFRIFLVPVFILFFFSGMNNSFLYSIMIFLLAGLTDILDGYIARKYNMVTKWGTILDPFADKLMLITVLTCLTIKNYIPLWVLIVIALKDILMIFGGSYLFTKKTVIPSNTIGKTATFLFYIAIVVLIFNKSIGTNILYLAVICSIASLISYIHIFFSKKNK